MRKIKAATIRKKVSELCIKANIDLRPDMLMALKKAARSEKNNLARSLLKDLIENARIASGEKIPICQDTGMAVVFCRIGQKVSIVGGDLYRAINNGVKHGYNKGFLRKSVVGDPIIRKNTGTNTPCIIHTDIIPGDKFEIYVMPKGFGSENKSQTRMFNPTAELKDIKDFVLEAVKKAGPDACPPFVIGVGIGGTIDKAAELSKLALLKPLGRHNPKRHIRYLETELLRDINKLGIGPLGLGGKTTALGVSILEFPTHIAGLPVAVNVSCHATRSATVVL